MMMHILGFYYSMSLINGTNLVLAFARQEPLIMQLENHDEILARLMQPSTIDAEIMDIKRHLQDVLVG